MPSGIGTGLHQFFDSILNGESVFNVVKFHKKFHPAKFVKVGECFAKAKAKAFRKLPDAEVRVWNLVFVHTSNIQKGESRVNTNLQCVKIK